MQTTNEMRENIKEKPTEHVLNHGFRVYNKNETFRHIQGKTRKRKTKHEGLLTRGTWLMNKLNAALDECECSANLTRSVAKIKIYIRPK